ncbi:MAG: FAD-dependent oxidoreductase [Deltaproteobacteria bacterium]|nr:FAD-dependent oxidoreductase [Deltaproteobacteria bacterium]
MGKNLVIIGGGAGGASIAAEVRRRDPAMSVTMIEAGNFVSTAACPMPYYIGDLIKDENNLIARTPEKFRETGVDVRINTRVDGIDAAKGSVALSDGTALPYDVLALATSTDAFVPPIPGVDQEGVFTLKRLPDAIAIKHYIEKEQCRKAVIVGGGFIGMEMCEALRMRGIDTRVIDLAPRPVMRWDPEFTRAIVEEMERHDVPFLPDTKTIAIEKGREFRFRLNTNRGEMNADLIIMAVGIRPVNNLAKDLGLETGKTGAVRVNFAQRTSKENIYAVGDCCEVYHLVSRKWVHIPLGDIANKQGRVAGINIGGDSMIFPGIVGAQSFRIFNLEVAATGIDEREALESGYSPACTIVWEDSIVGAMPDAKRVGIKLVADRSTAKLLGAQTVGETGAVSRINTLSCALTAGMGLQDIGYLDFAYAPPFSPAWDPIHVAAQQLLRQMQSNAVGACNL